MISKTKSEFKFKNNTRIRFVDERNKKEFIEFELNKRQPKFDDHEDYYLLVHDNNESEWFVYIKDAKILNDWLALMLKEKK